MQKTKRWNVVPMTGPTVIRNCPKCGNNSEYVSSNNFRVNANQNYLDVWLIYQCNKCKSTWNMEILSRVNPKSIPKDLYSKFLSNDIELAMKYAFDVGIHGKNKVDLSYRNISYVIKGEELGLDELINSERVEISCDYPLDIRMDKILSSKLGVSREKIKKMCNTGYIIGDGIKNISKEKVKNGMLLQFFNENHNIS